LKIQNKILRVKACDQCDKSCRNQFSACQFSDDKGKMFGLCSTCVDQHGRLGKNDYLTVKAADALLGTSENKTIVQTGLDQLRNAYEEKVKNGTTDDQIPLGEQPVKVGDRESKFLNLLYNNNLS
jgi:hypothetical protein